MSSRQIIERKTINKNTTQSKYSTGNSVYIVNSSFSGEEKLENLLFNILHQKLLIKNNKSMARG
jgi:hypothetical protein